MAEKILILGAGVVGVSSAYLLAQNGTNDFLETWHNDIQC